MMNKTHFKKFIFFIAVMVLTLSTLTISAYAKSISKVKLTFNGTTPQAGDSPGSVSCSVGQGYYVTECRYINDFDTWQPGDLPVVRVKLMAQGKYHFTKTSSSYFTISGMGARYSSAEMSGDTVMTVIVTLKKVSSQVDYDLSPPSDLDWDNKKATWENVPDARSYDVECSLSSGAVVGTANVSRTSVSLSKYITRDGDYRFRVRAARGTLKGDWSDYCESAFSNVKPGGDDDDDNGGGSKPGPGPGGGGNNNGGNNSNNDNKDKKPALTEGPSDPGWNKTTSGWWYLNKDGTYPYNGWAQIENKWYFFDSNGHMMTGWVLVNNLYYYLSDDGSLLTNTTTPDGYHVNADGVRIYSNADAANIQASVPTALSTKTEGWRYYNSDGSFEKNEWKQIDGKWYYFDSKGYSKTGWLQQNGLYYYFGADGAMLTNATTPDGHTVNADGVMIK